MTTIAEPMVHGARRARRINWSPYIVGAGIGMLSWVAFVVFGDPLGVTTAYSRVASLFAIPVIGSDAVAANSYWKAMPLTWDYGVWFLVGIPLGAFLSAILSGTWRLELVPEVWREHFGPSVAKRFSRRSWAVSSSCTAQDWLAAVPAVTEFRADCSLRCRAGCSSR